MSAIDLARTIHRRLSRLESQRADGHSRVNDRFNAKRLAILAEQPPEVLAILAAAGTVPKSEPIVVEVTDDDCL